MLTFVISVSDPYKSSSIKREASQDGMGDLEGPSKRPRSGGRAVDVRFLVQSKVSEAPHSYPINI